MKNIKLSFLFVVPAILLFAGCKEPATTANSNLATNQSDMPYATPNAMANGTAQGMANHNSVTNADNSAVNVRDRGTNTLTPVDQGNSESDRTITQNIRRAVVSSTNGFSMMARNIKIVTLNGMVTLRGPVKSDFEKNSLDSIAKSMAGEANVDDQLEVTSNP